MIYRKNDNNNMRKIMSSINKMTHKLSRTHKWDKQESDGSRLEEIKSKVK